jgi:hypothetical protein
MFGSPHRYAYILLYFILCIDVLQLHTHTLRVRWFIDTLSLFYALCILNGQRTSLFVSLSLRTPCTRWQFPALPRETLSNSAYRVTRERYRELYTRLFFMRFVYFGRCISLNHARVKTCVFNIHTEALPAHSILYAHLRFIYCYFASAGFIYEECCLLSRKLGTPLATWIVFGNIRNSRHYVNSTR